MAQDPVGDDKANQGKAAEKLLISSVMTHRELLGMIKERNPIIRERDQPKRQPKH